MTVSQDEPDIPRMTRAVQWLIALNAVVFFLQFTLLGDANMQRGLGFRFERLPDAWWTVGTHLFVHGGFWHLLLNLYMLLLFGPRLERAWGTREFRNFYLWCGLGGWIAHTLLVRDAPLMGATAAVLGVAMAYSMRWAEEEVYLFLAIPMRVRWFVAALVAINLGVGVASTWEGAGLPYLTAVSGMAAGWLFLRLSPGVGIDRLRQRVSPVPDVPDELPRAVPRSMPRTRERTRDVDEIVAQSQQALSRRVAPSAQAPAPEPDPAGDLDRVLDKISQSGIDSLTSEERQVLEARSRELRRE
jgi:membrane associated rhomboid family serine protease